MSIKNKKDKGKGRSSETNEDYKVKYGNRA